MRGDVPPSFGGPAFRILVSDRDADPACRRIAELEIGVSGSCAEAQEEKERKRKPTAAGRAGIKGTCVVSRVPRQVRNKHHPLRPGISVNEFRKVAPNWLSLSDQKADYTASLAGQKTSRNSWVNASQPRPRSSFFLAAEGRRAQKEADAREGRVE